MRKMIRVKTLAAVIAASSGIAAAPAAWTASDVFDSPKAQPASARSLKTYMIEFADDGVLHYDGGIGSLRGSSRKSTGNSKFDSHSPEALAYVEYLENAIASRTAAISSSLGRSLNVTHRYFYTHAGVAMELDDSEAAEVAVMPGVKSVVISEDQVLDTFRGPTFIGAPAIWSIPFPGVGESLGGGVRIAILDSGANSLHPSFADDTTCGFSAITNPKLIALSCATATGPGGTCNGDNPEADAVSSSHGVHTASTAAGNRLSLSTIPAPILPSPFTQMSGVAPCAGVNSYMVCNTAAGTCASADTVAATNNAIAAAATGIKVLNFSISGGTNPWTAGDSDNVFLDAIDAGIFVAASAGNTSATVTNPVGQVNHRGPWTMTVANSFHDLNPLTKFSVTGPSAQTGLQNVAINKGSTTPASPTLTSIRTKTFPANIEGCTASGGIPAGHFTGAIALVRRGNCNFSEKITNAVNAGATLVLVANNQAGPISMDTTGAPVTVPSYSISSQAIADNLIAYVNANAATTAGSLDPTGGLPDKLAESSLRGPTAGLVNLTKPDISGPGTDIYAAARTDDGSYTYLSGTSMSSPHVAGTAALMLGIFPNRTPIEVKSALQMTAKKDGWKDDGITPWDADDAGSGRVDAALISVSALTMDETVERFRASDPNGGTIDVRDLNLPSLRDMDCGTSCTFTRTLKSIAGGGTSWAVSLESASDMQLSVSPMKFTIPPYGTQELTITVTPRAYGQPMVAPEVAFGYITLTESNLVLQGGHITVAIRSNVDGIFKGDFETYVPGANPNIVSFPDVNFFPSNDSEGGSIRWIDAATCQCFSESYDLNIYPDAGVLSFFFSRMMPATSGIVGRDGKYSVMGSAGVVGPSSTFLTSNSSTATSNLRPGWNVDGYLGFRFLNETTGQVNYGYARVQTTAPFGRPFRILSIAYDKTGAAIRIP